MTELVEGVDPTLWVFVAVAVVVAFLGGMAAMGATMGIRYYRRQLRQARLQEPTGTERIKAVARVVEAPGYGRSPAPRSTVPISVDPEPTVTIPDGWREAGSELPKRKGVVLQDTAAATAALPGASQFAEAVLEAVREPEPVADSLADLHDAYPDGDDEEQEDQDTDPPAGGTPVTTTAVMRRHDWAHLRGEVLPASRYVLPHDWMMRAARRTLAYLRPPITVTTRLPWRAREAVTSLRSDLDECAADVNALWDQRPWLRASADARGSVRQRGRHRTGKAEGTATHRRVAA